MSQRSAFYSNLTVLYNFGILGREQLLRISVEKIGSQISTYIEKNTDKAEKVKG